MKNAYTQNNFLSYLLLLVALFVVIFFTQGVFVNLQISLDEREQNKQELKDKTQELTELNDLEKLLDQEQSVALTEIQGFLGEFSEKNILQYFHSYADGVNASGNKIIFRNINFFPTSQSDIGFDKTDISVSAIFSSESSMFSFINHLINPNAPYRFYITNFSYPMNEKSGNLQVTIPLTLYHK